MKERWANINASILAIIAEGFFSRLSFGIISFALPLYAYKHLGLSMAETGILLSLNLVAEQALKPAMGWAADRFGLKRSFTVSIAIRSVVALMLAFASQSWQIYLIRLLHGVSESLRDPSVNALIAENGGRKTLASSFAWYTTAKTSAGSVGKGAGGLLLALTASDYPTVFLAAFALSILPLYVVARFVPESTHHLEAEDATDVENESAEKRPARAAILPFAVLAFLISGAANMMSNLFPILATEYGHLSEAQAGAIYTLSLVVVIFSGPLFGWLSDNISHRFVLLFRGAANTLSSVVYFLFPTFAGIGAGRALDDMGKAAFRPAWGALMAHASAFDRRRRARTLSYLSLGEGMGEIAGPILAGLIWNAWGIPVVLGARVLFALAGEVYALTLNKPLREMIDEGNRLALEREEKFAVSQPSLVNQASESL
jgi:MFS family permease